MGFPFGQTVHVLRPRQTWDPYSNTYVGGDWDHPDAFPVPGAFVASTSTSMLGDATRQQALEAKSLFCEGTFDVRKGDRVFVGTFEPPLLEGVPAVPAGTVFVGEIYDIDGIPPAADTNPFTGWTPEREIPLTRSVG